VLALAAAVALASTSSNASEIYINQSGDSISLEMTQRSTDNYAQLYSTGDYNNIVIRQGVHSDDSYDGDETGGHEAYWTVDGDFNIVGSYQTDVNRGGGGGDPHHLANIVNGDNNIAYHTQRGKAGHTGFIEIQGSDNTVDLYQRGNGGQKWADVYLTGDDNVVDIDQRGSNSASAAVDLTNSGGAHNFTLTQNVTTSADSISVTGYCYNSAGCALTVDRNN
jgi:hypothetical protein